MNPALSVVIPIHNQEQIIRAVLDSVLEMTVGTYELILILDGCTDTTPQVVAEWIDTTPRPSGLVDIQCIINEHGLFETSCDNQGFRLAKGDYIVEVQADMKILTFGYNVLLTSPLKQYPDMIAVSGRCCHRLNDSPGSNVGKLGAKAEHPHETLQSFDNYGKVFLSHTANRGPLAIRTSMLRELNYLDEEHYVLGNDEHDLFARAWVFKQWRCGFVPIEVYSPLQWGSTRKSRSPEAQAYLDERMKKQSDGFLFKNIRTIVYPNPEVRPFRVSL